MKIYTSVLKVENQELSYNFGILYKNYFYYLIPAYADYFKKISPGKVLLYKILDWCFKTNINVLEFGQGEEEYKKKLTDKYLSDSTIVCIISIVILKITKSS